MGVGPFVRQAFRAARKGNPKATLVINDYRTDDEYAAKVIDELVDEKGKPLYDVIGIQSHMHGGAWRATKIWDVCERFARTASPAALHGDDADFRAEDRLGRVDDDSGGRARAGEEVVEFYTVLFSHPAVEAITWWDFTDQRAWQGAPAGFVRDDMTPKPAYHELMKLVKGKWWTVTEAKVDAGGRAGFHGFYGDYKVTVPGRGLAGTFTFDKTTTGVVKVTLD